MKRFGKYLLAGFLAFLLSGCMTGQIIQKVIHPHTPTSDSAAVMEAYDAYMTMLFRGYTMQDFRHMSSHWESIAMRNPFTVGSKKFLAYRNIANIGSDLGNPDRYKPMLGAHPLLSRRSLPGGGFYICDEEIYDLPFKLKDVMYFKNGKICDPVFADYCPNMSIKKALQRRIWQNNATVFIFGKDGRVQKVVTAYRCPPTKFDLD